MSDGRAVNAGAVGGGGGGVDGGGGDHACARYRTAGGMAEAVVERAFMSEPSQLVISGETPCVAPLAAAAT